MKSIGQLLIFTREKKKLTLDDVYKTIKIHPKYIKALENDDYRVFSGKVHSKGFLKIYAEYLELNVSDLLALWRREYDGMFMEKPLKTGSTAIIDSFDSFNLTPSLLFGILMTLTIVVFFGYLFFQYKTYTSAPDLTILYPPNNVVIEQDIVDLTGKTDLDSKVYINSQEIILNPDGSFAVSLKMKEGLNNISIKSVNKLDKQTEIIRTIIYRPQKFTETVKESTSAN